MLPLMDELLASVGARAAFRISTYDGSRRLSVRDDLPSDQPVVHDGAVWRFRLDRESPGAGAGLAAGAAAGAAATAQIDAAQSTASSAAASAGAAARATCVFEVTQGTARHASASLELTFDSWGTDVFLMMPAAAYAGNRFESVVSPYPPLPTAFAANPPTTVSDVPRLALRPGPSRMQLRAGDLATPAVGLFFPRLHRGLLVYTGVCTAKGWVGFDVEETDDRSRASVRIMVPAVREEVRYRIADNTVPSDDVAPTWRAGDLARLPILVVAFPCSDVIELYRRFFDHRTDLLRAGALEHGLPFSAAFDIIERKYNEGGNWEPDHGYYAVGMRESAPQDWQVGWVGGGMSSLPLLSDGSPRSRERARSTLDFMTGPGQDEGGLYFGFHHRGEFFQDVAQWYERHLARGGSPDDATGRALGSHPRGHLVRKSADAMTFLAKQILLVRARGEDVRPGWVDSLARVSTAIATILERSGQFGQYADGRTLEVQVGGTTSAAIAPAGLALAARVLADDRLAEAAARGGEHLFERFRGNGFTNGGPGDMLQNPDSESAYALLESMVVLWEQTGDERWIGRARAVADYASTWTMSYDFPFPPESTFGRLGMRTTGSTFANTQNKHSSPGLCTLSGESVFKLFRATGDPRYLELVTAMAHNITQYLSRDDRPVFALARGEYMPAGWMNERVETSDWLEPLGEIFYGSCWCEVSCMLTFTEIPGVYVRTDAGLVHTIDHVDAALVSKPNADTAVVEITNPTAFPARVKVLAETAERSAKPLGPNYLADAPVVEVEPGATVRTTARARR